MANNEEKDFTQLNKNISVLEKLKNYFEVQKGITPTAVDKTGAKLSNSSYAVDFFMPRKEDGEPGSAKAAYEAAKTSAAILIGKDAYSKIKTMVTTECADFYNDNDMARVDEITSAIVIQLHNDVTIYAMLCALFRVQNGYLKTGVDNIYVAPIIFNHDSKGLSKADWNVTPDNDSFTESINVDDALTPTDLANLHQVWGLVGIGNSEWSNLVSNILSNINLPVNIRKLVEHLFTKVFIDPTPGYNAGTVTLFPSSIVMEQNYSADDGGKMQTIDFITLNGYDARYQTGDKWVQAINQENNSTYDDLVEYFEQNSVNKAELLNGFTVVKHVYEKLGWTSGSDFDFTRALHKDKVTYVIKENIKDFVQSTALNYQNAEAAKYGENAAELVRKGLPFTVRDEELERYGYTDTYAPEITVSLKGSFEFACKGRLHPLRFAYYSLDNDAMYGQYRYHYLVPSTVSNIGSNEQEFSEVQAMSVNYINCELTDYNAVVPIQNDHYSDILDSGMGAPDMSVVASINCFYTPAENLRLYIDTALNLLLQLPELSK